MKRPEGFGGRDPGRSGSRSADARSGRRERPASPSRSGDARSGRRENPTSPARAASARRNDTAPRRTGAVGRTPRPSTVAPPAVSASASARASRRARRREEKAVVKRFTRRARQRRNGVLAGAGVVGALLGLIAIAVFSPVLALRTVVVDGTVRLDPGTVASAVSGQLGTPLALLDEGRLRDDLATFTLIRSYSTELVPPDTLVIHLVEREPIGVIVTATGFDVVDPAGVVIETVPTRPAGVPIIVPDDGAEGVGFRSMAQVLLALPADVLAQVDRITAGTRDDVTLLLAGSDQRVVWGSAEESTRKAAALAFLLGRYGSAGPGEYDVAAPGTAVFRPDA